MIASGQGVVDGDGNLVSMCPSDQGCFDGECIPACTAADLGKGSIGCEYWVPYPAFSSASWTGALQPLAIMTAWQLPIPPEGIPVGEVAISFLSHQPDAQNFGNSLACPFAPVVVGNEAAVGTGSAVAFELIADHPITLYDILPYGGATSFLPSASYGYPAGGNVGTINNVVVPVG